MIQTRSTGKIKPWPSETRSRREEAHLHGQEKLPLKGERGHNTFSELPSGTRENWSRISYLMISDNTEVMYEKAFLVYGFAVSYVCTDSAYKTEKKKYTLYIPTDHRLTS